MLFSPIDYTCQDLETGKLKREMKKRKIKIKKITKNLMEGVQVPDVTTILDNQKTAKKAAISKYSVQRYAPTLKLNGSQ